MSSTLTLPGAALPPHAPAAAGRVLALLGQLQHGSLSLQLPTGTTLRFGSGEPHASLRLHDWEVLPQVLARGDIGLAEAWIAGRWSTPDLTGLLSLLLANRRALDDAIYGHWAGRLWYRLRHWRNRNNRAGSRRNIAAHYDLGNDFYRLWLDPSMNYSSAWFREPGMDLAAAQHAKMERALREAGVTAGSRLLEIGCGWGAVAQLAARDFGARVTGVTLSHEQLAHARARLALAGVSARTDMRLQDYRDIADGPYDAIVSIEMVEAVGRAWWPTYFRSVARLLRPGGRACIQSIVIDDALWDRYIRGTDFIQQYVFPGGCLPCPREFERHAAEAGLRVVNRLHFGQDYARTLRAWRERFHAARTQVLDQGFDEEFVRLWDFYLCYCEAAFAQGSTDVLQYTLER